MRNGERPHASCGNDILQLDVSYKYKRKNPQRLDVGVTPGTQYVPTRLLVLVSRNAAKVVAVVFGHCQIIKRRTERGV